MDIFGEYIPTFMQVFVGDFAVYSRQIQHLDHLQMCLEKCREYRLSLNPAKCVFGVTSGTLLGHVVSKEVLRYKLNIGRFGCASREPDWFGLIGYDGPVRKPGA